MTIVALADVYQHVSPRPQPLTRFTLAPHIPDAGMRRGVYPLQSGTAPRGDPGPSSSAYRQQQQHQGASSSPFPTSGSRVTSQNASRTVPLPPIMSDGDQTSLLRLPIGKDTIVEAKSWTYKISPDHSTDTQAAQAHILALRRLSLAEGRLFAWSARKRRTDRTDAGQDGLSSCYDSTLYCTSILSKDEARALDETASSNAAVLGKRKDFEASNENGRAGASAFVAGEQGVACLMVRTFRLRSERQDPTPGDKTSGVEEHVKAASTPSPLNNSKGSPEDDLWGEGDDASARGNNEAERESALREEVSACRQSLDEVMQRNEKDSAPLSGGSTFNLLLLLEPKLDAREPIRSLQTHLDVTFRLALRAKVAEQCVLSRALDLEDQLRKSEEVDTLVGSETTRATRAGTSTPREAESAGAEEDGEIPDAVEPTMKRPQAVSRRPTAPLRRLITMDGGLLLLPRSAFSQRIEPSLALEKEPAIFVRIEASRCRKEEDLSYAAWNVQLKPEHLECEYGSPEAGTLVFLAPWGVRAQVAKTESGDEAEFGDLEGAESLHSLKRQLSERFELETGIEKERFLGDTWISVFESPPAKEHSSGQQLVTESLEMLWPRSLCFPLPEDSLNVYRPSSSEWTLNEVSSRQTKLKACHTPISDLLRATAKMLEEQDKERTVHKTTNGDDHKETAIGQDFPSSTDVLMKEVDPPVSRSDTLIDQGKADLGFCDQDYGRSFSTSQQEAGVADDNADENDDDLFGSEEEDAASPLQTSASSAHLPDLPEGTEPEADSEKVVSSQFSRFNDPQDGLYGMDIITEDDFAFFDDVDDAGADGDILPISDASMVDMVQASDDLLAEETKQSDRHPCNAQPEPVLAYADGNGIASDPSSMPGFTPSSFTDSSPATGHPMDRTPRTPTSPYYDVANVVTGAQGRVPPGMYSENIINAAWQGNESAVMTDNEASPDFDDAIGHGQSGSDADHSVGHPSAVSLPPHKRLRDLGDKYTSGKFAVPQSFTTAIAGGKRSRDAQHRSGATVAVERNADSQHDMKQHQPDQSLAGLPALHKLRLMSRMDDNSSEAGTIDGTASNVSDDDDSEDDDDLSGLDEEEREAEALRLSRLQQKMASVRSTLGRIDRTVLRASVGDAAHEADAPGTQHHPGISEDQSFRDLRDEWITDLLSNPHLLADLTPQTRTRSTLSTLKAIDCRDILDVCSGLSANISTSDPPHQLERLEAPRVLVGCQGSLTEFDATALRFWDKLGLSGAGGSRAVSVLALHSASKSDGWREEAHLWLERLRHAFHSLGLGKCDVMDSVMLGSEDDDVASTLALSRELYSRSDLRDETLRSLFSRVKDRLGPDQHVVVYALGDEVSKPDLMSIKFLESDLRAVGREVIGEFANHIHVRYTPWVSVALKGWAPSSRINSNTIQRHALALYDSLRVSFEHQPVRRLHPTVARPKPVMMRLPSFLLIPSDESSRSAVSFALDGNLESSFKAGKNNIEATGRVLFLHAAYDLGSNIGDLTCVSVIDETGQGGTMKCRRRGSELRETLRWIWRVVCDYAEQACVRWRIVICKTCTLSARELATWQYLAKGGELMEARCIDITLASRDIKNPLLVRASTAQEPLLPSRGGLGSLPSEGRFVDASQASFALYPTCQVVPTPAPPQNLLDQNDLSKHRSARESFVLSTRSSAVVTTFRGPQDCRIPAADWSGKTFERGEGGAEGTHTAWLHIYRVFHGRLFDISSSDGSTEGNGFLSDDFFAEHIRQVTRSQFGLRLLAQEPCTLDPTGLSPWPFAAIDRIRPVLDELKFDQPPPVKQAPPPTSRMQSYASTSTQTAHQEEITG